MVLQNICQTIRTIHLLWDRSTEAVKALNPRVLGMRHAEYINHLPRGNPAEAPDESEAGLALDRSHLWLSTMRETCYRVFASTAKSGVLFQMPGLSQVLENTCFAGLHSMHPRHLTSFMKFIMQPLLCYVPRNQEGIALVSGPIAFFFDFANSLLEAHFAQAQTTQSGAPGHAGRLIEEVVNDKLMMQVAIDVINLLNQILTPRKLQNGEPDNGVGNFGPVATMLLVNPVTAQPMLTTLCAAMSWPSAKTARMAAESLSHVLKFVMHSPTVYETLNGHMLRASIGGINKNGQHQECEALMINLVCHCYRLAFNYRLVGARDVMNQVENGAPGVLLELDSKLGGTQAYGDKKMRAAMRKFLKGVVGRNIGSYGKKEARIADIPEKLFLMSDQDKTNPVDEGEESLGSFMDNFEEK